MGLLLALGLALSAGCAPTVKSFLHPDVDLGYVRRVALLPFSNLSGDEFADERITSLFVTRLLSANVVEVVEAGAVREAMTRMNVSAGMTLSPEQIVALGKALAVDALFGGTVEEYGPVREHRETQNQVTASFTLSETQSGTLVWRAEVHEGGGSFWRRLFGLGGRSLHDVSADAVDRALGTLF
ncbi:MAG: hypothetical protein H6693_12015 [Candidatus Latescibacteria bacterium]|nr:hypothetical protein [Candidatus Latescibacterota bacterium]